MRLLLIVLALLASLPAWTQAENALPEKRCKCRARRDFLLEKSDSCFAVTRAEADRFFSCRCWDEAMSLYRAAKSCADANQNARSQMNQRIQACRDSAEQELRDSEQAARRQFLHAKAANLAGKAQEMLKAYDRSTAYRLADFAGQYIAPGSNAACLQALLDAWYYEAPQQPGQQEGSRLRVPYCYQLDYDMGGQVQTRFGRKGRLYAFAPANNTLYSWAAGSLKPEAPVTIERGLPHFDISPDDRTLLFYSDNTLLFWRSPKDTVRLKPAGLSLTQYCFSPNGNEFFFYNLAHSNVYGLDFRNPERGNVQRKSKEKDWRPEPHLLFNVPFEVLGMAAYEGHLWLAGRDSIAIFGPGEGKERQWKHEKTIAWSTAMPYNLKTIQVFPVRHAAVTISSDSLYYYRMPALADSQAVAVKMAGVQGVPLATKANASTAWFAYYREGLLVMDSDSTYDRYGCYLQPGEEFQPLHGAISPDGRWLTAATDTGTLNIWALQDLQIDAAASFVGANRVVFSQNGDQFACLRDGSLQVCATDEPGHPLFSEPDFSEEAMIDAMGAGWAAWRPTAGTLFFKNGLNGKKWENTVQSNPDEFLPVAFDETGSRVAFCPSPDSVEVRSLENGALIAARNFNGAVLQLRFVPYSGELAVIQQIASGLYDEDQTVAKIWNPVLPQQKPRPVRLQGYTIRWSDLAPGGDQIAFSSGHDVRIFRLDNLLDETARIRPHGERSISALAFHPDGSALATGYDDGTVVVWDLHSGEERFRLKVADEWIDELSFSADGNRLRLKTLDGRFFSRDISPDLIRMAAQNEYRRLSAFTPEQIREYDLERALDYSGNFQQLAESGDLPLIRSFFEYYRQQALGSNNIGRVKAYFESASSLFAKLEDPVTQRALRPVMYEIYEDYVWKLLLREKNAEAQRVLNDFNRVFNKPLAGVRIGAHTSLLRNDLPAAARQYADWTMRVFENSPTEPYAAIDSLEQQFRQLAEYDLLNGSQQECICALFSGMLKIDRLCPGSAGTALAPLDQETRLRWNIFRQLYTSSQVLNHARKARLLESAFADAKTLSRQNANRWHSQVEKTALALADAYTDWGDFEQGNDYAQGLYRQALQLLETSGPFKAHEAERLKGVAGLHYRLGNYLLATDQIAEATRRFQTGLEVIGQLLRSAPADSLPAYRNDHQAGLLTQLGMAYLLQGNTTEAKAAYDRAYDAMTYGLNSFYYGHVALLENREEEAVSQYKGIYTEAQLAQVLFEINRLAGRFPERRARLDAFMPRLRRAILADHPEMVSTAVDYWHSEQQVLWHFLNRKWKEAVNWNEKSLAALDTLSASADNGYQWKSRRLDGLLSRAYYLLYTGLTDPDAFNRSIAFTAQAEEYAEKEYPSYPYRDWLKTNLAHAYLLRNRPEDRTRAIDIYRAFLTDTAYDSDHWELLQKDFRDLHRNGLRWPDLKSIIEAIKPPEAEMSGQDWREIGVDGPGAGNK